MIQAPDPRWFPLINEFARDTPWLHPFMIGYADYGIVVSAALLLAGRWIARRSGDLNVMAAAIWAPLGVLAAVAINQPIWPRCTWRAPKSSCPRYSWTCWPG